VNPGAEAGFFCTKEPRVRSIQDAPGRFSIGSGEPECKVRLLANSRKKNGAKKTGKKTRLRMNRAESILPPPVAGNLFGRNAASKAKANRPSHPVCAIVIPAQLSLIADIS
jgi:hypothetical protein